MLVPRLVPASGLALMRPHLFSAKFLRVQISNLELDAEFLSPKGLKYHGMLTRGDRIDAPDASGLLRTGGNSDFSSPLGHLG